MGMSVVGFEDQDTGVDESLLAQFRQEAAQAYRNLNMEAPAPAAADERGRGVEQILTITSRNGFGAGDAPPSQSTMRELELEPSDYESEEGEGEKTEMEKQQVTTTVGQRVGDLENSMAAIEVEEGLSGSDGSRELAQQTFAQLLKASMDATEDRAGQTEEETVKQTLKVRLTRHFKPRLFQIVLPSLVDGRHDCLYQRCNIVVVAIGHGPCPCPLQCYATQRPSSSERICLGQEAQRHQCNEGKPAPRVRCGIFPLGVHFPHTFHCTLSPTAITVWEATERDEGEEREREEKRKARTRARY